MNKNFLRRGFLCEEFVKVTFCPACGAVTAQKTSVCASERLSPLCAGKCVDDFYINFIYCQELSRRLRVYAASTVGRKRDFLRSSLAGGTNWMYCMWGLMFSRKSRLSDRGRPSVTICTTRFNTLKLCILPTQCICVFRMVLTINSHSFRKQHEQVALCSGDVVCFLWGTNWICIYYLDAFCPHSASVCSVWFSQ
jgi:hypothetical protein